MKYVTPILLLCLLALPACKTWDNLSADLGSLEMPSLASAPDESRSEEILMGGACPGVEVVQELSSYNEFSNPSAPAEANRISSATIGKVENSCEYGGKSVTVDLKLGFDGMLGPQGRQNPESFYSYPFFVAVTEPGGDILAKEVFAASMTYDAGQDRQVHQENLRQIIPVPDQEHGARYKVLVGFQLSQEQLEFNRAVIAERKAAAEAARQVVEAAPDAPAAVAPAAGAPAMPVVEEKAVTVVPPPEKIDGQPLNITR